MIADPKEGDLVQITYGSHAGKFGRITCVVTRRHRLPLIHVAVKGVRELLLYPGDMELA